MGCITSASEKWQGDAAMEVAVAVISPYPSPTVPVSSLFPPFQLPWFAGEIVSALCLDWIYSTPQVVQNHCTPGLASPMVRIFIS